ncbi:MAG: hypothetical protein ACK4GN_16520 [Runella sp.]
MKKTVITLFALMVLGGAYSSNANEKMIDCCRTATVSITDSDGNTFSETATRCHSSCTMAEMQATHAANSQLTIRLQSYM